MEQGEDDASEAVRRARRAEAAYVHPGAPPAIDAEAFQRLETEHGTRSGMIRALEAQGVSTPMIAHTLAHYRVLKRRSAYAHVCAVLGHG